MKKTLHALAAFAALFTFPYVGHSQDGSTCDSGIVLYPTHNYDYSEHTTSDTVFWFEFTATSPYVISRLKHRNMDWMCLIYIPYNYSPEPVPVYIKLEKTNCRIIQKPNIWASISTLQISRLEQHTLSVWIGKFQVTLAHEQVVPRTILQTLRRFQSRSKRSSL